MKNYLLTADGVMFLSNEIPEENITGADVSFTVKELIVNGVSFPVTQGILNHILSVDANVVNISICKLSDDYEAIPLIVSVEKSDILSLVAQELTGNGQSR